MPCWKGVALTAEAEIQFYRSGNGNDNTLPWLNIKFSSYNIEGKGKAPTVGSSKYSAYESVGIAVGKGKSLADLAHYKYQIDLAGGAGQRGPAQSKSFNCLAYSSIMSLQPRIISTIG